MSNTMNCVPHQIHTPPSKYYTPTNSIDNSLSYLFIIDLSSRIWRYQIQQNHTNDITAIILLGSPTLKFTQGRLPWLSLWCGWVDWPNSESFCLIVDIFHNHHSKLLSTPPQNVIEYIFTLPPPPFVYGDREGISGWGWKNKTTGKHMGVACKWILTPPKMLLNIFLPSLLHLLFMETEK